MTKNTSLPRTRRVIANRLYETLGLVLGLLGTSALALGLGACANTTKRAPTTPTTCEQNSPQAGQVLVVLENERHDSRAFLSGVVLDQNTPLHDAPVVLTRIGNEEPGQELDLSTDDSGSFSLEVTPNTQYEIIVYGDGYFPATLHRIQVDAGKETKTLTCMKRLPPRKPG